MSGIARVQPEATVHPGKLELLAQWLPDQWWFDGDPSDLEIVATFRVLDPGGRVGRDCVPRTPSTTSPSRGGPIRWTAAH